MRMRHSWIIAAMLTLVGTSAHAQRRITSFATGAVIDHRVNATGDLERVTGAVWGAGLTVGMSEWLGLQARIGSGSLSARTPDAEGRSYSEADFGLLLTPDRWIALDVQTVMRTMETPLARQRWVELRAGTEVGLDLIEGVLRGTMRLSIAPWVSVSGHPSPDLSIGAGTGLQYTAGRLAAGLSYSLDRYDFPAAGGSQRIEQRSALTARIGWRLR